ncbi:MAG: aminopeptidase P N-terminal domain-containing protein, partial [Verrucomicrobiota bacterium]
MRYQPIDPALFVENRQKLCDRLPKDSFAVLYSADIPWRSADGSTRFIQNSDLFYLTGVDQEETILLLCPSHPDLGLREILFVRETSDLIAIWEGHKLTKDQATARSGIARIEWTDRFESVIRRLTRDYSHILLNHNEHPRAGSPVDFSMDARHRRRFQDLYPHHRFGRLAPILHDLRVSKSEIEIDLLREACQITEAGFRRLLKFVNPGRQEYEIEAELIHEFTRRGSRGFAYEPIIASGQNANVLHYLSNDQKCEDGDLLLLDVAAEYAGYNADLTRTIPVNGQFSPRQREVYEAVLRIFRLCIDELAVPGKHIKNEYHPEVARACEEELIGLGLLDRGEVEEERRDEEKPEEIRLYRKYFMHGVSHSLGIDVHDVTPAAGVFVENMCVTVEPGIYLAEEGFGVRLENDIIIRSDGNIDLM